MPTANPKPQTSNPKPSVLALMAHPDDIEILCAGTLILLEQAGWAVHMATMTAGDLGSMTLSREKISRVRRKEAAASAALLGASYTCLGFNDLCIVYSEAVKRRVSALLRLTRPDLLITHAQKDYMADHEETARIAREAAFVSTIPNWAARADFRHSFSNKTANLKPCEHLPAVLYADAIELLDDQGKRQESRYAVNITSVIAKKKKMLAAHASQRDWLRAQHGEDEYLLSMRRWSAERARDFARREVKFAEGFSPHHGHAFPRTDFLKQSLGRNVIQL